MKQGAQKDTDTGKTPMAPSPPTTHPVFETYIDNEPKTLSQDELNSARVIFAFAPLLFSFASFYISLSPLFLQHFFNSLFF